MADVKTQRRFAVMGDNIHMVVNKLITNQRLCRLLKYQVKNPFSDKLEDVDGDELLNEYVIIVPKIPDSSNELRSFIIVYFDKFAVNVSNPEFKISTIKFMIACPFDSWLMDESSLRPYMIMQEIDTMFNQARLKGIGTLQFSNVEPLVLSSQLSGYTMTYSINDFN